MGRIDDRIAELGLILPRPLTPPADVKLLFPWVNIRGGRAFVSGHGPVEADGTLSDPRGQAGSDVGIAAAADLARKTGLAMLGSLRDALGDLDRIEGWARVFGMVNSAPGFDRQPSVINGFSELIVEVFGPDVGRHARSAVGMAALPFGITVEIEAEVLIRA